LHNKYILFNKTILISTLLYAVRPICFSKMLLLQNMIQLYYTYLFKTVCTHNAIILGICSWTLQCIYDLWKVNFVYTVYIDNIIKMNKSIKSKSTPTYCTSTFNVFLCRLYFLRTFSFSQIVLQYAKIRRLL